MIAAQPPVDILRGVPRGVGVHVEQADRRDLWVSGRECVRLGPQSDRSSVHTRIKQGRHRARVGIDAGEVRPVVPVAAVAGEREAAGIVGATVLPRYDVFDLERNEGRRLQPPVNLGPC